MEVPWAFVQRKSDSITAEFIPKILEPVLSDYKLPRKVVFVHRISLGASGKVSRNMLKKRGLENQSVLMDDLRASI